jgi:N-carbamoyl-L-amino-acid hydrolase
MQRRKFIKKSSLTTIGMGVFGSLLSNNYKAGVVLSVNSKRIESRIFELAKFGVDEKGRGYRVAYTKGDIEGRAWFMDLMKKAGLDC